jgi:hypothetical protein
MSTQVVPDGLLDERFGQQRRKRVRSPLDKSHHSLMSQLVSRQGPPLELGMINSSSFMAAPG